MPNVFTTVRTARGWTQAELARQLGCSRAAVSLYEIGARRPETETAYRLLDLAAAGGLTLSLEDVYPRGESDPAPDVQQPAA